MKRFALPLAVVAALAVVSFTAESVNAAGRRVYVAAVPRATVLHPLWRIHHPRVVLRQPVGPVVVPLTTTWSAQPIVIQHGNHWHYVPAVQPIGTSTYLGW